MQAVEDNPLKNNNLPRSKDCIYLRASDSLQGGHDLMNLATGRKITCSKVIACATTRMVIERVDQIAEQQGYKSLKFFNRVKKVMILADSDLLAGVSRNMRTIIDKDGEVSPQAPPIVDGDYKNNNFPEEEDEELDVDEMITSKEVVDLLEDAEDLETA